MREGRTHECYLRVEDDLHQCKIALSLLKGFHVQADLRAKNPLQKEWSVDEERLLLSLQEGHEPELLTSYKLARKENPKLFNKFVVSEPDLRHHLKELQSNPALEYRYKLLLKDVESSMQEGTNSIHMAQILAREYHKPLPKLHKNVVIKLQSRNGNTGVVEGNAKVLSNHSPHLKSMLQHVTANKYEVKTIQLSEKDRIFDDYPDVFDVFHPSNVSRYVEFTENPQLWTDKEKAQEQLKSLKAKQNTAWEEFQASLQMSREQYVSQIKEMRDAEEEILVKGLNKCLEDDVQHLKYLHQAHMQQELQRMNNRYDVLINDVQDFYNSEHSKLNELNLRFDENERVSAEQQVADAEYHIRNIFPDKGLLKLLILADVLRDPDLRTCCLQRISARVTKFYMSPELGCGLIRSMTISELLSMCSNQQLLTMGQGKGFYFKQELFNKEVGYRQAQMRETYASWTLKDLTDAQIGEQEPWPRLLEEEIQRRRDHTNSFVSIDAQRLNTQLILLDRDRRTATLIKSHKYASIVGTQARQHSGWGKWYWECKIIGFERSNGCTVSIGWDAPRTNYQESYVPGLHPGEEGAHGWMWTSDGLLHHSGVAEDVFMTFDRDDVIGVGLDQDRKLLTFYKNGQQITLLKKKNDLKLPEKYFLYPSICMYSARSKQQVKVVAEFCGPFDCKVPKFFKPYGSGSAGDTAGKRSDGKARPGSA
uniref:B30.2/SPRY domain-containing protein n=1 Tax=Eutreptiella gymnastica TaxID=73025 RepID=A0A7S1J0G6_9EUGL|mmetsp:Transcript_57851/g.103280  ORF Transcript_57851/g.103280 Transcript_57851/m.103280 type:complete len:707 (+) Transcript_57851:55-2175(+)